MMADTFRHRFSTKPWIAALGAYDYGERLYSPGLRRWMSRDPIEEEGGVNLYAMCGNDPLDKFDSLGFFISCRQNGEIRIAENQKWKLVKLDYMKDATHSAFVVALTRIVAVWELEGKVKCCCSILGFIPWNRTVPVKKKITVEIPLEPVVIAHNATSVPVPVTFPFSGMSAVGAVLGISGEAVLNKFFTLMVFDDRTDIPRIAEEVASSAPSSIEKGEWPRKPCD
ncbi:MAG: RHS repeat-associated core domain-containing protein [Kiritimatiellae bacterium]|nr:RHS repeat-associated core domain-containing protein [Kiritimatiellia bacterium]